MTVASTLHLHDDRGNVYLAEFAAAWDGPADDPRPAVYYEDESRPAGARPLYRLTVTDTPGRRAREAWLWRHRECGPQCCVTGGACHDDTAGVGR